MSGGRSQPCELDETGVCTWCSCDQEGKIDYKLHNWRLALDLRTHVARQLANAEEHVRLTAQAYLDSRKPAARKPYTKPVLRSLGKVDKITIGSGHGPKRRPHP
jgi:hypothetical protein